MEPPEEIAHSQHEPGTSHNSLAGSHYGATVVAVRGMAGCKGQNNHWKELDQSQHPQVESAPGKRVDLPADCDR